MLKIGIIPNLSKSECKKAMEEFCGALGGKAEIFLFACADFEKEEKFYAPYARFLSEEEFFDVCDIITVMGGDGSILQVAPQAAAAGKPILGINLGRVGYLASAERNYIKEAAERLVSGDYEMREHMMLNLSYDGGKNILALNDVVASRSEFGRIIELSVYVDDEYADTYTADGIVISTPTGSTAYSLSAGGPIAYPTMDVLMVTPICSHDLHSRTIVLPSDKKITVKLGTKYEYKALITVDGKIISPLKAEESFSVCASAIRTKLIKMDNYGFYDLLRMKLRENS
ncbi:MAG: NAD(+)/NADH kinase [Ruminococcaceae bacterium]|nr:NAD(+)/NADH kinase [Oscillospiraceae bacterium]